jgi:hypothetical protein
MNKVKRYPGILLLVVALVIVALTIGGCGGGSSTPSNQPAPLPSQSGDIEPNDSVVFCQIALFLGWDGSFPRQMRVYIRESTDVPGLTNYTKNQVNNEIDVILDEDLDWLMLGQQITGNIQLKANPEGGTAYHISNIVH